MDKILKTIGLVKLGKYNNLLAEHSRLRAEVESKRENILILKKQVKHNADSLVETSKRNVKLEGMLKEKDARIAELEERIVELGNFNDSLSQENATYQEIIKIKELQTKKRRKKND